MRVFRISAFMIMFTLIVSLFIGKETELCLAAALPPGELISVGDFSVAIADVQREEDTAVLYFSITKLTDVKEELSKVSVILEDDHDNQYEGQLTITAGVEDQKLVSDILCALPKGFTYVEVLRIRMSQAAPIMKVSLNDEEFDFASVKLVEPPYLNDYGSLDLSRGQPVEVGRWLVFSTSHIEPEIRRWELVVELANNDYNPLLGSIKIGVQEAEGTISWSEQTRVEVPGQGQIETRVVLPISGWKAGVLHQPRNILLQLQAQKTDEQVLKVYAMRAGELPPLVGLSRSPYTSEEMFINAYERGDGKPQMGNPTSLVYWFGGGDIPRDKNDILVQEFFRGPRKCVVMWDAQKNSPSAFVVYEPIWEAYTQKGGPYFRSEAQGVSLGAPTSDTTTLSGNDTLFGTPGLLNIFEGGAIALAMREPQSKMPIAIMGVFYQKWKEIGLVKGMLGFPLKKENVVSVSGASLNTAGWVQIFEGGLIVHHSLGEYTGKTFVTYGSVCHKYQELGALNSYLGFPVMDQYQSVTGWPQAEFEDGYIATANGHSFTAFTFPPGKIAFVSDRDGNTEIYTIDLSGRNLVNLTKNPANDWYPKWSPSGREIVFVSERNPQGIYIMNANGSNQRFITHGEDPSWFPDGNRIVFTKPVPITEKSMLGDLTRSLHRIFTANNDGTDVREIKINLDANSVYHSQFRHPIVSPDGSKIAFSIGKPVGVLGLSGNSYDYELHFINLDGTGLRRISAEPRPNVKNEGGDYPSWFPDGRIAYKTDSSSYTSFAGVNYSGGALYTAKVNEATDQDRKAFYFAKDKQIWVYHGLDWIFDGGTIVFSGYFPTPSNRGSKFDLWITHVNERIVRKLTGIGNNLNPTWSAAGAQVQWQTAGEVIFKTDEQIAMCVIQGGNSIEELREELVRFLNMTSDEVLAMGAGKDERINRVFIISNKEFTDMVKSINKSDNEIVVRLLSSKNVIKGEPILAYFSFQEE